MPYIENQGAFARFGFADEILTPTVLSKRSKTVRSFEGKRYDYAFDWSYERIYCSELVWKVYKRGANVELGELQELKEFDLHDPVVAKKLRERFGNDIPIEETVISPNRIFGSDKLMTVNTK